MGRTALELQAQRWKPLYDAHPTLGHGAKDAFSKVHLYIPLCLGFTRTITDIINSLDADIRSAEQKGAKYTILLVFNPKNPEQVRDAWESELRKFKTDHPRSILSTVPDRSFVDINEWRKGQRWKEACERYEQILKDPEKRRIVEEGWGKDQEGFLKKHPDDPDVSEHIKRETTDYISFYCSDDHEIPVLFYPGPLFQSMYFVSRYLPSDKKPVHVKQQYKKVELEEDKQQELMPMNGHSKGAVSAEDGDSGVDDLNKDNLLPSHKDHTDDELFYVNGESDQKNFAEKISELLVAISECPDLDLMRTCGILRNVIGGDYVEVGCELLKKSTISSPCATQLLKGILCSPTERPSKKGDGHPYHHGRASTLFHGNGHGHGHVKRGKPITPESSPLTGTSPPMKKQDIRRPTSAS